MAFNLYSGDSNECIEHHEEGIFSFVEPTMHTELSRMKDCFYRDPEFSFEQSNDLVHELISLLSIIEKDKHNKYLVPVLHRLLAFFSLAYKSGHPVRSESD